jgi:hypothetical protein
MNKYQNAHQIVLYTHTETNCGDCYEKISPDPHIINYTETQRMQYGKRGTPAI